MAANVTVAANGATVTVTVTAVLNSGYNLGTASVQLVSNASGLALNDTKANPPIPVVPVNQQLGNNPASASCTFNNVGAGGYTVLVTCDGETTTSVTSVQAGVGVVQHNLAARRRTATSATRRRPRRG
jgi:hypothetical protein